MYSTQTESCRAVQTFDALAIGRILVTGHEFDEPNDIRVFHKSLDLDPFLDRMEDIIAQGGGGRGPRLRKPLPVRGVSNNGHRPSPRKKIELVLYTSAASQKCQKAIRTIREVLDQYSSTDFSFTICDLASRPTDAEQDSIVFTPTLVKRGPGPRTWIVGNLEHAELLIDLLEVSGVARRR